MIHCWPLVKAKAAFLKGRGIKYRAVRRARHGPRPPFNTPFVGIAALLGWSAA